MTNLRMLGDFVVDPPPMRRLPRKAKFLMAVLAVEGKSVSRERLATMLWPDQGEEQARHSLRNCVLEICHGIGPGRVIGDQRTLHLEAMSHDVALLEAGEPDAYRGEFLDDLPPPPEADELVRWVDERRDHYRIVARLLLLERGGPEDLRRAFAVDPTSTEAAIRFVRHLLASGSPTEAVRAYKRHNAILHAELGIAPSPELRQLVRALRTPEQSAGEVLKGFDARLKIIEQKLGLREWPKTSAAP